MYLHTHIKLAHAFVYFGSCCFLEVKGYTCCMYYLSLLITYLRWFEKKKTFIRLQHAAGQGRGKHVRQWEVATDNVKSSRLYLSLYLLFYSI